MKRHTSLFVALLFFLLQGFSQNSPSATPVATSIAVASIVTNSIAPVPYSNTPLVQCAVCGNDTLGISVNQNGTTFYYSKKNDGWQTLLVFLPVLLFGVVLFYILLKLNGEHYRLGEVLSENTPTEIDIPNPDPEAAKTTPFIKKSILPRSASRLTALLSGMCTVAIATCTTSYSFYVYLKTGRVPNLDNLFDVLLALGMGVVPYAVNKLAGAFSSPKQNQ